MKERPILFTGEMVRAILEGRKTQTRRVMKPQPVKSGYFWEWAGAGWNRDDIGASVMSGHSLAVRGPYGLIGDRLWVKETHVFEWWEDEPKPPTDRPIHYHAGDGSEWDEPYWLWPHYRATDPAPELYYPDHGEDEPHCRWRPSIFMPRWASRITLEIVDIRIERLQHISVEDVLAEGIKQTEPDGFYLAPLAGVPDFPWGDARMAYAALWNSINEKSGFGWDQNPWVWVVEFKRVEK